MWKELGYKVYLMGKGIMEWREKGAKGKEEAVVTSSEEAQTKRDRAERRQEIHLPWQKREIGSGQSLSLKGTGYLFGRKHHPSSLTPFIQRVWNIIVGRLLPAP